MSFGYHVSCWQFFDEKRKLFILDMKCNLLLSTFWAVSITKIPSILDGMNTEYYMNQGFVHLISRRPPFESYSDIRNVIWSGFFHCQEIHHVVFEFFRANKFERMSRKCRMLIYVAELSCHLLILWISVVWWLQFGIIYSTLNEIKVALPVFKEERRVNVCWFKRFWLIVHFYWVLINYVYLLICDLYFKNLT